MIRTDNTSSYGDIELEEISQSKTELGPNEIAYVASHIRPKLADLRHGITRYHIPPPRQEGATHTIGTFVGVFVPCWTNIVNIIFFSRLPFVVGKEGGLATVLGLLASFILVLITMFSLSAFSTNGEVETGGAYYLISRTIGPAAGASCGFCLVMAGLLGAATANIGLAEQIVMLYTPYAFTRNDKWDMRIISMILSLIIGFLANYSFPIRTVTFFRDFTWRDKLLHRINVSAYNASKRLFRMLNDSIQF